MNIFKMKNAVSYYLRTIQRARDNDSLLTALVWQLYIEKKLKKRVNNMSATELLSIYANTKLPSAENIARTRRKLQEHHPELRGHSWKERHNIAEEVRVNMHTVVKTL